jgi:hypothetical protein
MTHAEQVLIRGKVFLYKQKAPFVPSGKSVLGALEYDEATDRVRCHECGEWFGSVGQHARRAHMLSPKDYNARHGLRLGASLCAIGRAQEKAERMRRTPNLPPLDQRIKFAEKGRAISLERRRQKRGVAPSIRTEFRN